MQDEWNPYRAPVALDEQPATATVSARGLQGSTILMLLMIAGGTIAAFVDIESIVFTGPATAVLGLLVAYFAFRHGNPAAILLGLSGPVIAVAIFLLINLLSWGPGDAQKPLPPLIAGYAILAVPIGIYSLKAIHTNSPTDSATKGSPRWTSTLDEQP